MPEQLTSLTSASGPAELSPRAVVPLARTDRPDQIEAKLTGRGGSAVEFRLAFYRDGTVRRYSVTDYGESLAHWRKPEIAR